jgi:pimeloyl-ACP methyl ester carboxylesterase
MRSTKALREKFTNAKTVEIGGSGHSLMIEAPDEVLDALIGFIS